MTAAIDPWLAEFEQAEARLGTQHRVAVFDDSDSVVDARIAEDKRLKADAKARAEPWPQLNPLPEPEAAQPKPFPFDALGPVLGPAARAISDDVQAPDALAAGSVLAAASLAAMAHADVLLPHGQRSPLSLFFVSGASSGDRKTACDAVALAEVERVRKEAVRQYLVERQANDKATPRSLTIGKATVEGLQLVLKTQPTVGLFSAEGGELLGGHSMREERRVAGLAFLAKGWGGETLDTLTRGDGLSVLLGRRMAMHVMTQPVLLRQLLADPLARDQGLLARCLIAQPATLAGTRVFRDCNATQHPAVRLYEQRIADLLRMPPSIQPGGDGCELAPRLLQLTSDARRLWIEAYDDIECAQAPGGKCEFARPFASKAAEHAARMAAVIELVGNPASVSVAMASMDGGLRVADFYLDEHVRLTGAGIAERAANLLHTLFAWMVSTGRLVQHADVLQRSPNPIRKLKAGGITPLLAELSQRGYIRQIGNTWEVRPDA